MAVMRIERTGSFLVSSARRDQEIEVISSASLLIAAAMRSSDWSVTVSEDISELGDGYRDVASAARLVIPGRCSI